MKDSGIASHIHAVLLQRIIVFFSCSRLRRRLVFSSSLEYNWFAGPG
jgi:hypothetical protein